MVSSTENEVLGTEDGLDGREPALARSNDALMMTARMARLMADADSAKDPAHGNQEHINFAALFGAKLRSPAYAFATNGGCLRVKPGPGNAHPVGSGPAFLDAILKHHRFRFTISSHRGATAFADPEVYTIGRLLLGKACTSRRLEVLSKIIRFRGGNVVPSGTTIGPCRERPGPDYGDKESPAMHHIRKSSQNERRL